MSKNCSWGASKSFAAEKVKASHRKRTIKGRRISAKQFLKHVIKGMCLRSSSIKSSIYLLSNLWFVQQRTSIFPQSWLFLGPHIGHNGPHKEEQKHPDHHVQEMSDAWAKPSGDSAVVVSWRRPTDNCRGGGCVILTIGQTQVFLNTLAKLALQLWQLKLPLKPTSIAQNIPAGEKGACDKLIWERGHQVGSQRSITLLSVLAPLLPPHIWISFQKISCLEIWISFQ